MVLSVSEIRNHHDWAKPGPIVSPTTDHGSDYQRRNLDNLGNMLAAENALVRKMPGDNCDAIYLLPVLPDCVPVPSFVWKMSFLRYIHWSMDGGQQTNDPLANPQRVWEFMGSLDCVQSFSKQTNTSQNGIAWPLP